jgi:hypothetical protein
MVKSDDFTQCLSNRCLSKIEEMENKLILVDDGVTYTVLSERTVEARTDLEYQTKQQFK